jgi:outer membrane lipoprotein-sorting protein
MKSWFLPAILSLVSLATTCVAGDQATLTATDILKQSAARYAALNSYSDEGVSVSTLGTNIAASYSFTLKLARTNLYLIIWREPGAPSPRGVAWDAGGGDFLWMGKGTSPAKYTNRLDVLSRATGISGGAAAAVPGTFFDMNWGSQLRAYMNDSTRAADDKVGDTDCYVLTRGSNGHTNTLWIGKQDLLIHQVENDTSAAAVRAALEAQAARNPQVRALLDSNDPQLGQDVRSVETHANITANPSLTTADFHYFTTVSQGQ